MDIISPFYRFAADTLSDLYSLRAIIVVLAIGYFCLLNFFSYCKHMPFKIGYYDYGLEDGPRNWQNRFPSAAGRFQSPINIQTDQVSLLPIHEPLIWNHYDEIPYEVFVRNTGHTVELKANFSCNTPTLTGADLLESYVFKSLCFRWSFLGDQGSEHSIDYQKYPVELQVTHSSRDYCNTSSHALDLGILVISYFFAITPDDNPYLDPIILNLRKIRRPGLWVQIPSFPLSWLCYNFGTNFYTYGGSLTEPPCSEGVTWLIFAEPMAISSNQLFEFRSLLSTNSGRIVTNSRPVQNLNSRIVCLNKYIVLNDETEDDEDDREIEK